MPPANNVDVQDFINEHPFSAFQWTIFALCFFIVLLDGFDTAAIGYIAPSLITEWGIARPALAPVLSAALFGLAFGALSAGPLADRFGRKAVLVVAVLVSLVTRPPDEARVSRLFDLQPPDAPAPATVDLHPELAPKVVG